MGERERARRQRTEQTEPEVAPPIVREVLSSPGRPLDEETRASVEPRFGHDFSRVRIHTDARAAASADAVNALAYTVGQDIVFGAGQYQPGTSEGRRLLAHELAHTVQHTLSRTAPHGSEIRLGAPQSVYEREANAASIHIVQGNSQTQGYSSVAANLVQRQMITPLGQGGGMRGLLERDRNALNVTLPPVAPGLERVKVWINTFIPMAQAGPFGGDNRGFSNHIHAPHRTHQEIEFETNTLRKTIDWKHNGMSHLVVPSGMLPPFPSPAGPRAVSARPFTSIASATAPLDTLTNGPVRPLGDEVLVHFEVDASVPLLPGAPAINLIIDFYINTARRTVRIVGRHDGFPAYEAYITANGGAGVAVYTYDPRDAGEDPDALFPPMDKVISTDPTHF